MLILGIETSCDETSAAILQDGTLLSNVTTSQLVHSRYGGVVPELASRAHQRLIVPIVNEALRVAGTPKENLDAVAAVFGPGLVGSLLVGLSFAKAFALGIGRPFVGVNHMEAHVLSNLLEDPKPAFPFVNLTVSGGHTQLVLVHGPLRYEVLGETRDDAAGEAFDKVAKLLGVGYPGGPNIDRLARSGDPNAVKFPRPYLSAESLEFSFSGLKTAVLYYVRKHPEVLENPSRLADVCAGFQAAVVDVLVGKLLAAAARFGIRDVAVAGGVAANSGLRESLLRETGDRQLRLFIPKPEFCTDNGAMVALAGYLRLLELEPSSLELQARPNLELGTEPEILEGKR